MQQRISYICPMKIKKAHPGRQSIRYAIQKYHNYNTPGRTGCQIKEEENESNFN